MRLVAALLRSKSFSCSLLSYAAESKIVSLASLIFYCRIHHLWFLLSVPFSVMKSRFKVFAFGSINGAFLCDVADRPSR